MILKRTSESKLSIWGVLSLGPISARISEGIFGIQPLSKDALFDGIWTDDASLASLPEELACTGADD